MKLAFATLLLAGGVAQGGQATSSVTTAADCAAVGSHVDEGNCLYAVLPRAEAELSKQVNSAHQRFKQWALADDSKVRRAWLNTAASELLKAQSAWRSYRDAHCASIDGHITGNDHGTAAFRCKLELTTMRIKEVMSYSGGS